MDKDDNSLTRSNTYMLNLFEKANLEVRVLGSLSFLVT